MISLLLILLPLLTGLAAFFIKDEKLARTWAVLASFATLTIAILSLCCMNDTKSLNYHCEWLPSLGASFSLKMDGVAQLLCLLNTIAYPLVFIAGWDKTYKNAKNFFDAIGTGRHYGCFFGGRRIIVLFLLGTGIDTDVLSLFAMGW